jgi:hypothetical protein
LLPGFTPREACFAMPASPGCGARTRSGKPCRRRRLGPSVGLFAAADETRLLGVITKVGVQNWK